MKDFKEWHNGTYASHWHYNSYVPNDFGYYDLRNYDSDDDYGYRPRKYSSYEKFEDESEEEYNSRRRIVEMWDEAMAYKESIVRIDYVHPYLSDEASSARKFLIEKLRKYLTSAQEGDPISMAKIEAYKDVLDELNGLNTPKTTTAYALDKGEDTPVGHAFDKWVYEAGLDMLQAEVESAKNTREVERSIEEADEIYRDAIKQD